ncbi:MAG: nucleotidyl transferase AbiEii/AbiGii toxin family protein [Candidatus Omnitrophota bacterium]
MDILKKHELFEIEVLEKLNSGKFLEPLVFGGGTMLRLCHELNRYSVDLDFWFIRRIAFDDYFTKLKDFLEKEYEITDACIKHYTLLFELRSGKYPKRMKIEIRKQEKKFDFQERIAFSRYDVKQVILKVHTLEQTMKNKIEAALQRKEIRDCFDIEFLLKRGIAFNAEEGVIERYNDLLTSFSDKDFKVTLGSILDSAERKYYIQNKFSYTLRKLGL